MELAELRAVRSGVWSCRNVTLSFPRHPVLYSVLRQCRSFDRKAESRQSRSLFEAVREESRACVAVTTLQSILYMHAITPPFIAIRNNIHSIVLATATPSQCAPLLSKIH